MTDEDKDISSGARREVSARNTSWARTLAASLASAGVKPNLISWLSVAFGAAAGAALVMSQFAGPVKVSVLLVLAVICIGGRLLCNLFDGMVAVEGGLGSKSGEIFNDLPDRISDAFILVGAGYAVRSMPFGIELGWLAGLLAIFVAYARTLAGATGATPLFLGPMAKQHRMAVLSISLIVSAAAPHWDYRMYPVAAALALIILGCLATIYRRTAAAVKELEEK